MPAEHLPVRPDLQQLLTGYADAPAMTVDGIRDDSRAVAAGDVFFACQGATVHGLSFAADAIDRGAVAVVWDSATGDPSMLRGDALFIPVDNLASRLGDIANRWYGTPSRDLDVIGVTGTNGKTSVAWLAAQAFNRLQQRAAYLGTLGSGIETLDAGVGLTTPTCFQLHHCLAEYRDQSARRAAIEVSSHALDQDRVAGTQFSTAVFTNLSRDHIDYHGDMSAYGAAKARLFSDYACEHRIVGIDSEFGAELAHRLGESALVTSARRDAVASGAPYVFGQVIGTTAAGSTVAINSTWGRAEMAVAMPGHFNVNNALQVLAILLVEGIGLQPAVEVVGTLTAPPGRMERIAAATGPQVFVDYAHTPDALEAALTALRPHVAGRLWCVFGCGGDRDRGKRPMMGRIASRLSDRPVITSDNPRTEDPAVIIGDIQSGVATDAYVVEDRERAIRRAIAKARESDTILIAGKGHEDYQVIGTERRPFSDQAIAREALAERLAAGRSS